MTQSPCSNTWTNQITPNSGNIRLHSVSKSEALSRKNQGGQNLSAQSFVRYLVPVNYFVFGGIDGTPYPCAKTRGPKYKDSIGLHRHNKIARQHWKPADRKPTNFGAAPPRPARGLGRRITHPVCPIRLVCNLQLDRAQTLTSLSHPADTMTGADGEGENRTHETHSV